MKRVIALLLIATMCAGLCACGSGTKSATKEPETTKSANTAAGDAKTADTSSAKDGEPEKILFFTAFIGDFGLSDMGYKAVQSIAETYNMKFTLVEYGSYDAGLAVNSFWDALETTDYDYFFGPTWYIEELLDDAAAEYPDTTFILYDVGREVTFDSKNIYSISFAQNESAFVAAILQALMTEKGKIGVISTDSPILNDFSTGWIAGCKYAKKELGIDFEWLHSYLADQSMSGTYEAMNVMYDNGCDAVWPITAQFMLSGAQAAEEHGGIENGYFVMGCDYDQWSYFKGLNESDSKEGNIGYENILTSITKNIEPCAVAILDSVKGANNIEPGNRLYGVAANGVGYVENDNFLENVPQDVQDTLKEVIEKIGTGEIVVPSYFEFSSYDAFATYRDNVDAEFAP